MPFFHRETPEERQRKEQAQAAAHAEADVQARSLQALAAGGIPIRAQERVTQLRAGQGGEVPFSTDLSVNELFLSRKAGYQPLGLVTGSSVYHMGWNRWTFTGEMQAQTQAQHDATISALTRMRLEAVGMGAVGVVGTKLEIRKVGWSKDLIEVVAIGTAIHVPGAAPAPEPFLSDFSAQEFVSLLQAGGRPAGLVVGNCTYYIYTNWGDAWQNASWYNQEHAKYTESLYAAQRAAFGRMHSMARNLGAQGVVGVHIVRNLREIPYTDSNGDREEERSDYVLEFLSWGTAIQQAPGAARPLPPTMMVDLNDADPLDSADDDEDDKEGVKE
ncbi:MAG TPA: heavy metal-binding domain-containing protein [Chloroflexota bacterium]|nr:heavy metal-binding domain-containing protein [Chloroflexota bacterium]